MKSANPPAYTSSPLTFHPLSTSIVHGQDTTNLPKYFQAAIGPGWTTYIPPRNQFDGGDIFVSESAYTKYTAFTKHPSKSTIEQQHNGYAMPFLRVVPTRGCSSSSFLTFRRHVPPPSGHAFDRSKDSYDFCTVQRRHHYGYVTYIFEFMPDPSLPRSRFHVLMFRHTRLPIADFVYKDRKHRWVDESRVRTFREDKRIVYGYRHVVLDRAQTALTDSYPGHSDKLDRSRTNPYVSDHLKKVFDHGARLPKAEHYGVPTLDVVGEYRRSSRERFTGIRIAETERDRKGVDYESVMSLKEDDLVMVCIAMVFVWEKDEERRSSDDDTARQIASM